MEDHESSRKTTHVVYSFTEKKNVLELINRLYIIFNDKLALESDLEKLTSKQLFCFEPIDEKTFHMKKTTMPGLIES